ncbi:hypothetical protein VEE77_40120 [Escherichia coli]|nr:hypothetical protein VEE77_40120 [Escherichia coli]
MLKYNALIGQAYAMILIACGLYSLISIYIINAERHASEIHIIDNVLSHSGNINSSQDNR